MGDLGLILDQEDPLEKGTASSPLQYSGLENSMDRGACLAIVHGVAKSWTRLSDFHIQVSAVGRPQDHFYDQTFIN